MVPQLNREKELGGQFYVLTMMGIMKRGRIAAEIASEIAEAVPGFLNASGTDSNTQTAAVISALKSINTTRIYDAAVSLMQGGLHVKGANGELIDLRNEFNFDNHFFSNEKNLMPVLIWILSESIKGFLDLTAIAPGAQAPVSQ